MSSENSKHIDAVRSICAMILLVGMTQEAVYAQTLYARDATITVEPNTTLVVEGSVENQGTIVNGGHVKVAGPWINSGAYEDEEGEVTFNSNSITVPQIIHHNGQAFSTVTISGGTKKVLLSDVVIGKEIRFDDGVVENAGNARIVFRPDVVISGASDRSHIHGVVYHQGDGQKIFPIGNGSTYLPVELSDVGDASAMIGIQALEFGNMLPAVPPEFESISRERYWHIDAASGSLPKSPIVLPLKDLTWAGDPEKVVVVQSESMTEKFRSIGRSYIDGASGNEKIKSELNVSLPFVALARVAPEQAILVHNAVSNNDDDLNDFVRIENLENYPTNKFSVFNRWGDLVFQIANYDNDMNVFRGYANVNNDARLVTGTYFYVLEIPGRESLRGFITVKN